MIPPIVCLGIVFVRMRRYINFINGGTAELDVHDILDELPDEFEVIPDLNLTNRGNIDFVVVGPTGVWTLEVKSHRGRMGFDGTRLTRNGFRMERDFLKQAQAEMYAVKECVEQELGETVFVKPVVVFASPGAHMQFGLRPLRGVQVIGVSWLIQLLTKEIPYLLSRERIEQISSILRSKE